MFDWVTCSIWFVGLVILVVWIIVPLKEFGGIVKARHAACRGRIPTETPESEPGREGRDDA